MYPNNDETIGDDDETIDEQKETIGDETIDDQSAQRKRSREQADLSDRASEKKGKSDFVQTHLDGRAFVRQGEPTLVIRESHDGNFGVSVSKSNPDEERFKDNYREAQIQYHENGGGSGLDENVSTATTADIRKRLDKEGYSSEEIHESIGEFSKARDHVGKLLWTKGDTLNGHPGALTKIPGDMRNGITSGHNTADKMRAKSVKHEFESGLAAKEPKKDVITNTKLVANVETTIRMSQPYAQLKTVDASKAKDTYHAKHGPLIEQHTIQPGFEHAIAETHNVREEKKIHAAQGLIKQGFGNLVSPAMREQLAKHGNDADVAHHARYVEQDPKVKDTGPPKTQTVLPKQPKTLREMSKENEKTPELHRLVSDPRPFIKPQEKTSHGQATLGESVFNASHSDANVTKGKDVTKTLHIEKK